MPKYPHQYFEIYRSKWRQHHQLRGSRDVFPKTLVTRINAAQVVSLANGGETAKYAPDRLVTADGNLSLETASLSLGPETAQTSDGVIVHVSAIVEFRLTQDKRLLEVLLDEGRLKVLGRVLADRGRAIIASEIAKMHYGDAIKHQDVACDHVSRELRNSVHGTHKSPDNALGVHITSVKLRVSGSRNVYEGSEQVLSNQELDLSNQARRILRFLQEEAPTEGQAILVTKLLLAYLDYEKTRQLANGTATIVHVTNDNGATHNSSISDWLDIVDRDGRHPKKETFEKIRHALESRTLSLPSNDGLNSVNNEGDDPPRSATKR